MLYLVSAPLANTEAPAVVVTGAGLEWQAVQFPIAQLVDYARKNTKFENCDISLISDKRVKELKLGKDALVYPVAAGQKLYIDTKPMASSRFKLGLMVVVQEIRMRTSADAPNGIPSGAVVGYVVALPDGRVLRIAVADLLKHCEQAKQQGRYAIQNMQYVGASSSGTAHLKNYEGVSVGVFGMTPPKAVNAAAKAPVVKAPESVPVPVQASAAPSALDVFTPEQIEVLRRGKKEGVNFAVYANPAFDHRHMDVIRSVLKAGKDPSWLLDPTLPLDKVQFYGYDLANGADISQYFNMNYTTKQAVQVKLGYIRQLDVSQYSDPSIDGDEMEQIRVRLDADAWNKLD